MLVKIDNGRWLDAELVDQIWPSHDKATVRFDEENIQIDCKSRQEAIIKADEIAERVNMALSHGMTNGKALVLIDRFIRSWKTYMDGFPVHGDDIKSLMTEARDFLENRP